METVVLRVDGMSCGHCVKAVSGAVNSLPGIGSVSVDLATGTATVEHDPALSPLDVIRERIEEQGYEVLN